ncbi:hypothetical protein M404DRAFT_826958 [Pisolithus tinctorius Marx 270]|uniref:Uncharacterized protein n=1 Tax=Pisolithus tinctorius Marx 270 TaxID=870435 RepID=A0A0C3NTZ1_PISTI|nr:hypothetical protein M404DRAFT_826958 [Pisolithus tinctorius Marx 270]
MLTHTISLWIASRRDHAACVCIVCVRGHLSLSDRAFRSPIPNLEFQIYDSTSFKNSLEYDVILTASTGISYLLYAGSEVLSGRLESTGMWPLQPSPLICFEMGTVCLTWNVWALRVPSQY